MVVWVAKAFQKEIGRLSQSRFLGLFVSLVPVTSGQELSSAKVIAVSVPENKRNSTIALSKGESCYTFRFGEETRLIIIPPC